MEPHNCAGISRRANRHGHRCLAPSVGKIVSFPNCGQILEAPTFLISSGLAGSGADHGTGMTLTRHRRWRHIARRGAHDAVVNISTNPDKLSPSRLIQNVPGATTMRNRRTITVFRAILVLRRRASARKFGGSAGSRRSFRTLSLSRPRCHSGWSAWQRKAACVSNVRKLKVRNTADRRYLKPALPRCTGYQNRRCGAK